MLAENFKKLFFAYGRYLQYDLIHSLEQETKLGRNVDILLSFRDVFKLIITTPTIKDDELEELIKSLHENINAYIGDSKQECLDIGLDKLKESTFSYSRDKELFEAFKAIRQEELLNLGKNTNEKIINIELIDEKPINMIEAYKELFNRSLLHQQRKKTFVRLSKTH